MENKNKPAHPVECSLSEEGKIKGCQTGNTTGWEMGLSKREWFAGMALQGLLANPDYNSPSKPLKLPTIDSFVKCAIHYADALLAELEKTQP